MGVPDEAWMSSASAALLAEWCTASQVTQPPFEAVPRWLASLRQFDAAAQQLHGLRKASNHLQVNLDALLLTPYRMGQREVALIQRWPDLVEAYVNGDNLEQAVDALMDFVIHPAWPRALGFIESAQIREQLLAFHAQKNVPAPKPLPSLYEALEGIALAATALFESELSQPKASALAAYRQAVDVAVGQVPESPMAAAWLELLWRLHENVVALEVQRNADLEFRLDEALAVALMDTPQLAMALLAHQRFEPQDGDAQAAMADELLNALAQTAWLKAIEPDENQTLRAVFGLPPMCPEPSTGETAPPLARCDSESLVALAHEFGTLALGFQNEVDLARQDVPNAERQVALERCIDLLRRVETTCASVGLLPLTTVFEQITLRCQACVPQGLSESQCLWLRSIMQHVRAYLAAPNDPSATAAMVEVLSDASWPPALEPQFAGKLEVALQSVEIYTDPQSRPLRVRHATPQAVALSLPQDINPELLDGLLSELPTQSAEFSSAMERVVCGQGSLFDLDLAKRAAHTLKGAANTVGVRGIASLTHHLEDILVALTQFGLMPNAGLAQVLVRAADCLEGMSEALQGVAGAPEDSQAVLQAVLDWANQLDEKGEAALTVPDSSQAALVDEPPATNESSEGLATVEAPAQAMLRVPAGLVDELLRLVGETMIANTQIKEQLRQTRDHVHAVTRQNHDLQQLSHELETLVDIRGVGVQNAAYTRRAQASALGQELDHLEFERFSELHTTTRRLIEATTDAWELSTAGEICLKSLSDLIDNQGRLHAENQKAVFSTRLVSVSTVVSRLARSVRQTSRLLGKSVTLKVKGENTQLDVNILNELLDPLMHILRNCVDHGIEGPAQRVAAGKNAEGHIELSFGREGAWVVVCCQDDGSGLDLARIRSKASQQGLLGEGVVLTDEELARLILRAGFSTRDQASEVSGRGIGMDVVYGRVQQLKGNVRLKNQPGLGLIVELRVPASLMTAHGLLVRMNERVVVLSSFGVGSIVYASDDQVSRVGEHAALMDAGQATPLIHLNNLLGIVDRRQEQRGWFPALIVQLDTGVRHAVGVQAVLSAQELVIKDLGPYVPHPPGVMGVTILGDGQVAAVLDLPQLLREVLAAQPVRSRPRMGANPQAQGASRIEAHRMALVVDDSLSARRAAAQVLRDAGFEVRTAIDGMQAAAILEKVTPQVILVDMEMPRMNGLELTTHVRNRAATRHIPIIMITSRSTQKHRQMAESAGVDVYLTKPFNDEELEQHVRRVTKQLSH